MRLLTGCLLLALLTACGSTAPAPTPTPTPGSSGAPSPSPTATAAPVWPAPADATAAVRAAGLTMLAEEGQVLHIHAHLDVFVAGMPVAVPPEIGIDVAARQISPVHTHDDTGVIHIESPVVRDFTLGQFFAEWRQPLTGNPAGPLTVYVAGKPYTGDPAALVLRAHQEIAVVYGTPPPKIPVDYSFDEGL
jgi:hypothetical protein